MIKLPRFNIDNKLELISFITSSLLLSKCIVDTIDINKKVSLINDKVDSVNTELEFIHILLSRDNKKIEEGNDLLRQIIKNKKTTKRKIKI